ncbi:hypothetical protein GWI33_014056, partial [Rhynchophorus ferrugineus]
MQQRWNFNLALIPYSIDGQFKKLKTNSTPGLTPNDGRVGIKVPNPVPVEQVDGDLGSAYVEYVRFLLNAVAACRNRTTENRK